MYEMQCKRSQVFRLRIRGKNPKRMMLGWWESEGREGREEAGGALLAGFATKITKGAKNAAMGSGMNIDFLERWMVLIIGFVFCVFCGF